MPLNKVRALCAQIAIEIDPNRTAALIEELTNVILIDYAAALARLREEPQSPPSKAPPD